MRNQINSLCPSWLLEHPSRAQPCCSPASLPSPWPVPWLFSTFLLHALPLPSQPSLLLGWLTGASCTGSLTNPLLPSSSSFPLVPSYPFLAAWTSFPPLLTSVLAISRSAPPTGPAGCSRLEHEGPGPAHLRSPHHTLGPVAGCSGLLQVGGFSCQPEAPRYAMAGALMQLSWADRRWKDASGQEVNWAA